MQEFTGTEYVKIAIANEYGHDKWTWAKRIAWVNYHRKELEDMVDEASNPFLFHKAVNALRDAEKGKATGYIMALDCTASGLQIMSALSGCKETAKHVNLINTNNREDVYTHVANEMNKGLPDSEKVTRSLIKKPVMTHYYNKGTQESLSDAQQTRFAEVLQGSFTGAEETMKAIQALWDRNALYHKWVLPDGHVAKVKVMETIDKRIEIDELDHLTFTYRFSNNQPSSRSTSLCPNIVHSIDAYIAREMVRKANGQGYQLAHIHDSFWCHPNHMNKTRANYIDILADIAASDLLQDIMSTLTGNQFTITKSSQDLATDIKQSEYALS